MGRIPIILIGNGAYVGNKYIPGMILDRTIGRLA
jgi:hypothetical protein